MKKSFCISAFFCSLALSFASPTLADLEVSSKIYYGDAADIDSFPGLASLHYIGPNGQFISQSTHVCGATQIDDEWILTAAHCIETYNFSADEVAVAVGVELQEDIDSSNLQLIELVITHPDYDDEELDNDIALLKLADSSELDEYLDLASDDETLALTTDSDMTIVGWGDTEDEEAPVNQLMTATVSYVTPEECESIFHGTGVDVTDNMICASGGYTADTCSGDSGGPMLDEDDLIHGLVSWGIDCSDEYPSGYTRVANYITWIDEMTAGLSASSPEYFGILPLGDSTSSTLVITNQSDSVDITIGDVSISDSTYTLITDDCSGQTLEGQGECVLEIEFEATSSSSTDATLTVPNSKEDLEIELTADVADLADYTSAVLPDGLTAYTFGQYVFTEEGSTLQASLSSVADDSTDLLLEADEDGTVSFDIDFSSDEDQSIWVSELNDDVLATYYTTSSSFAFSYHVDAGEVLQIEYTVSDVGTATISDLEFVSDSSLVDSSDSSSSDSSSSSSGGSLGWLSLMALACIVLGRRRSLPL